MYETPSCRLCIKPCHDHHHSLYNPEGLQTEVYTITAKYFTSKLLDLENGKFLNFICVNCWNCITEFHTFHESILETQILHGLLSSEGKLQMGDINVLLQKSNSDLLVCQVQGGVSWSTPEPAKKQLEAKVKQEEGNANTQNEHCSEFLLKSAVEYPSELISQDLDSRHSQLVLSEAKHQTEFVIPAKEENPSELITPDDLTSTHSHDITKAELVDISFNFNKTPIKEEPELVNSSQDSDTNTTKNYDLDEEWHKFDDEPEKEVNNAFKAKSNNDNSKAQSKPQPSSSQRNPKKRKRKGAEDSDSSDYEYERGSSTDDEKLETQYKRPRLKTVKDFDNFIAKWRPNLECVFCHETSNSFSLLIKHFKAHHPKEKCHILCCEIKFYHRHDIEKHIDYHNATKELKCFICFRSFMSRVSLKKHEESLHSDETKAVAIRCPKCSKSFVQKRFLTRHLKLYCHAKKEDATAAEKDPKHICKECGKSYKNVKSMRMHVRTVHLGKRVKNIKCDICDKGFNNSRDWREHMGTHTGERAANCSYCPKTYLYRSALYEHFRKEHAKEWEEAKLEKYHQLKDPKHKCIVCGNVYKNTATLSEHQSVHPGEFMFPCTLCPKKYKYSPNLAIHLKQDHPQE